MYKLKFDIDARQALAVVTELEAKLQPAALGVFLQGGVTEYLQERARNRFGSEGDDVVGKWAPLKQSTISRRLSAGFPAGPINKRTGELEQYVTNSPSLMLFDADSATMVNPSNEPQAGTALWQKVTTAQAGRQQPNTVARPVLGMNEKDRDATMTLLERYITAGIP